MQLVERLGREGGRVGGRVDQDPGRDGGSPPVQLGHRGADRQQGRLRGLQQVGLTGVEGVVHQVDLFMGVETGAVTGGLTSSADSGRPAAGRIFITKFKMESSLIS